MIHRSVVVLRRARTIVRDPRKAAAKRVAAVARSNDSVIVPNQIVGGDSNLPVKNRHQSQPLPFQPSVENQQSVGSTLVSYGLAGIGVSLGVTFVGALFGGF